MLARMKPDHSSRPLTFLRRGQPVTLGNVPPDRTLLQVLREDLHCTGTKEGCGEGDCGACTVVLGEAVNGKLTYKAVNSCIRLAHSVDGMAVFTVEDLASPTGDPHPAQEAMVQCHGSQCGFCTPGFVMSLFGLYQNTRGGQGITREQAQVDLSGNLCRCTGYRPILDAAEKMGSLPLPPGCAVDEAATVAALKAIRPKPADGAAYLRPTTLPALLQARAAQPKAQVVAGCTDVGLWVTKQHQRYAQVLDVTAARELRRVETYPHHLAVGAAVSLTEAFSALVHEYPTLKTFAQRFAGLPVRNAGTLGGNVANGSPIGDSMPLLIALGANVVLMRWDRKLRVSGSAQGLQDQQALRRRHLGRLPGHPPHGAARRGAAGIHWRGRCGGHAGARPPDRGGLAWPSLDRGHRHGRRSHPARRVPADFRHARQRPLPPDGAGQPAAALLAGKPGPAGHQPGKPDRF